MAGKRASQKAKFVRLLASGKKRSKMDRAGLYARVSTHDQKTHPDAIRGHEGLCRETGLDRGHAGQGSWIRVVEVLVQNFRVVNIYAPTGNPIGSQKFA